MINDLEVDHVLQVLDKSQLGFILCSDAKHLMSAEREPQCFTSFYSTQDRRLREKLADVG